MVEVSVSEISMSEMSFEEEYVAPYFTKIMEDVTVTDGSEVTFEVIVVGNPMPEVRWYVDGTEIRDEPEYEIMYDDGVAILILLEVIPEDEGEYVCMAINEIGEATCKANLYVEGKVNDQSSRSIFRNYFLKCPLIVYFLDPKSKFDSILGYFH